MINAVSTSATDAAGSGLILTGVVNELFFVVVVPAPLPPLCLSLFLSAHARTSVMEIDEQEDVT